MNPLAEYQACYDFIESPAFEALPLEERYDWYAREAALAEAAGL